MSTQWITFYKWMLLNEYNELVRDLAMAYRNARQLFVYTRVIWKFVAVMCAFAPFSRLFIRIFTRQRPTCSDIVL